MADTQEIEQNEIDITAEKAKAIGKEIGVVDDKPADDVPEYEVIEQKDEQDERLAKEKEPRTKERQLSNREKRIAKKEKINTIINTKDAEIQRLSEENQQMKRWKEEVDGRLAGINQAEIQTAWNNTQAILANAKKDYADSFTEGDGAKNVAALAAMSDANDKLKQLNQLYVQVNQRQTAADKPKIENNQPDPVLVNRAQEWANKNAWYKPDGKHVDSEIAKAISGVLVNEGYDPKTEDFWDELDDRLAEKKIGSDEIDEEEDEPAQKVVKKRSGPPVSGAANRGDLNGKKTISLPTSYIKTLKDNGIWDDLKRRNKVLAERERILKESGQ